jgi:hypothetical protein
MALNLLSKKVGEKIKERLSEDPLFDVIQIGDIELYQTAGNKKVVKKPEEKGNGNDHAGSIVQTDSRLIRAEDIGIFRESNLHARDTKRNDTESVQPVPDSYGGGGKIYLFLVVSL